ncbi:hypothetical protein XELAEV_18011867mg [Xenopus laevis]|uniref:Uncharacterized protein n=1 Tax=Xenopus laevis TaxID=8355 RepID=A0A974DLI8_XENLA|nr:hypothetical protein XELAEV_18011867mg [Xenopus laevis]
MITGLVIIEPVSDWSIFFCVQFKMDGFQGFHIKDIVSIIQWRFLIIKWGKSHPLEVSPVSFFLVSS